MSDIEQEKMEMKNNDLSPAMLERANAPKKTWFFKRLGDGKIFATEEKEAWQIVYNRSTWKRRDFQMLGTSDGTTYNRIIRESMVEAQKLAPEIEKKKVELQKYMASEENLIMNEVVDMEGDPSDSFNEANKQKVLRLRTIMDRIHKELDSLEERYKTVVKDVVTRATEEEMKIAIENQNKRAEQGLELDWPDENLNVQTPAGSSKPRAKILGMLQGRL
jgi:hypothetical protein